MEVMEKKPETDKRPDDLSLRVESIDRRMETGFAEMREEFRAVRAEMKSEFQSVRAEMKSEFQSVRAEMKSEFQSIRAEMKGEFQAVRQEMAVGFTAVRAEMAAHVANLNQTMYRLFGGLIVAWVVGVIAIIAQT
jgi:ElaB/YqjD/DUF883 family membrane-anchored ribosome-binding protein